MCGWYPQRPGGGVASPVSLELELVVRYHVGSGKLKPGPLQKQQVILTAESSLLPNLSQFKVEPGLSSNQDLVAADYPKDMEKSVWEVKRENNAPLHSERPCTTIHC